MFFYIKDLETIGHIADLLSILGAIFSTLAYLKIKDIQNKFVFRSEINRILNDLNINASIIFENFINFDSNKTSIAQELAKCESTLKFLCKICPRELRFNSKSVLNKCKYRRIKINDLNSRDLIWNFYEELLILISDINNHNISEQWKIYP